MDRAGDAVVEGAWRIAFRATGDPAAAEQLVAEGCRAFRASGAASTVALLQCVLDAAHASRARQAALVAQPDRGVDRRRDTRVRDAFELVHVGGARLTEVAQLQGCSAGELARRLMDAVARSEVAVG